MRAAMENKRLIDLPCTIDDLRAALRGLDGRDTVDLDSEFRRTHAVPGVSHVRIDMLVIQKSA